MAKPQSVLGWYSVMNAPVEEWVIGKWADDNYGVYHLPSWKDRRGVWWRGLLSGDPTQGTPLMTAETGAPLEWKPI